MIHSTFAEKFCRVSGAATDSIETIDMIYDDLDLNTLPLTFAQKYKLVIDVARIARAASYDSGLARDCDDIIG